MGLWVIVPVNPLRGGKSRLASVLPEEERALLNYTLLGNTIKTLKAVQAVEQVLVVSRDQSALSLAREYGARTVQEDGNPGLNTAIRRSVAVAHVYSAHEIMILPADLPLITPQDIQEFLSQVEKPPILVIAPDRRMTGTNALYVNPSNMLDFRFGPNSFQQHIQQAEKFGATVKVCRLSSFALDLDLPEDLELLKKLETM